MLPKNIFESLRGTDWSTDAIVPKHAQLSAALTEAIVSQQYAPGTKLPTEAELAASTSLSLGTVQRALRTFVEDGIVERRRGHGSFVANRVTAFADPAQLRFLHPDGVSVLPISLQVVSRKRTDERGPWSEPLSQRGNNVLEIERLIGVDGRFTAFGRFFVLADRIPFLESAPLRALDGLHLTKLVAETVHVHNISQQLTMEALPIRICKLIDVVPGILGLVLRIFASDRQELVYLQEIYIPPTRRPLMIG